MNEQRSSNARQEVQLPQRIRQAIGKLRARLPAGDELTVDPSTVHGSRFYVLKRAGKTLHTSTRLASIERVAMRTRPDPLSNAAMMADLARQGFMRRYRQKR